MQIYHYHPDTGAYLGRAEADPSPMEPGAYLIPANATTLAPPSPEEGLRRVFVEGAWQQLDEADVPVADAGEAAPPEVTHDDLRARLGEIHAAYGNGTTHHRGLDISIDVEARVNARGVLDEVKAGTQPLPFQWFAGGQAIDVTTVAEMQAIHDAIYAALRRGFTAKGKVLAAIPNISQPADYDVAAAFRAHL
ncbi:hypothetical protein [Halomonas nitroreducens]|uniref:Phage tail protein n=1 Tax=Halomonas nitroreducens TaxID=447425 RepID=A0A3S0K262_9GAMM|nr:hypothetical protein [Halomonas nitroreducens]RTR01932.1 hypothetical protein EKG36_13060 [Halomonas nitroreducens]